MVGVLSADNQNRPGAACPSMTYSAPGLTLGVPLIKRIHVTAAGFGVVVAGIVALVIAVSSGMATTTKPLAAGGDALALQQTSHGHTIVAANGRTLYLFEADK